MSFIGLQHVKCMHSIFDIDVKKIKINKRTINNIVEKNLYDLRYSDGQYKIPYDCNDNNETNEYNKYTEALNKICTSHYCDAFASLNDLIKDEEVEQELKIKSIVFVKIFQEPFYGMINYYHNHHKKIKSRFEKIKVKILSQIKQIEINDMIKCANLQSDQVININQDCKINIEQLNSDYQIYIQNAYTDAFRCLSHFAGKLEDLQYILDYLYDNKYTDLYDFDYKTLYSYTVLQNMC